MEKNKNTFYIRAHKHFNTHTHTNGSPSKFLFTLRNERKTSNTQSHPLASPLGPCFLLGGEENGRHGAETPPPGGQGVELRELAAAEKDGITAGILECLEGHLV